MNSVPGRTPPGANSQVLPFAHRGISRAEALGWQVAQLLADPPPVLVEAMSDVLTALNDPGRRRDVTLDAIFTLHCRLLEALTVADFVLGKAYGLGRAIAETALRPAGAMTEEERAEQFRCVFEAGRLITVRDWLADLKAVLVGRRGRRDP